MKISFKISNFNISGESIPEDVCDKILIYHIAPMMDVRNDINIPIWASEKSGYRPYQWEIDHGRSGTSQHTYTGKGATDWTCKNFKINKDKLLKSIIKYTNYTRITEYNSFFHCDYKETTSGKREFYTSGPNSKWIFKKFI